MECRLDFHVLEGQVKPKSAMRAQEIRSDFHVLKYQVKPKSAVKALVKSDFHVLNDLGHRRYQVHVHAKVT